MRFNLINQKAEIRSFLCWHLSDHPYCLFPPSQGWQMICPASFNYLGLKPQNYLFFQNNSEVIVFILTEKDISAKMYDQFHPNKVIKQLKQKFGKKVDVEIVFVCDESLSNDMIFILGYYDWDSPHLMVFSYGRLYFKKGSFKNQSMNLRLANKSSSASFFYNTVDLPLPPVEPDAYEMFELLLGAMRIIVSECITGKSYLEINDLMELIFVDKVLANKPALNHVKSRIINYLEKISKESEVYLKGGFSPFEIERSEKDGSVRINFSSLTENRDRLMKFLKVLKNNDIQQLISKEQLSITRLS